MSEAKQCDRCGELYKTFSQSISDSIGKYDASVTSYCMSNGFKFMLIGTYTDSADAGCDKDLCPKCFNELVNWYLSPKENNENVESYKQS